MAQLHRCDTALVPALANDTILAVSEEESARLVAGGGGAGCVLGYMLSWCKQPRGAIWVTWNIEWQAWPTRTGRRGQEKFDLYTEGFLLVESLSMLSTRQQELKEAFAGHDLEVNIGFTVRPY